MVLPDSPVYFEDIQSVFADNGFNAVGVSALNAPTSLPFYEEWLNAGFAGEMNYLHSHLEMKRNPEMVMKKARSVISVMVPYFPHPHPIEQGTTQLRTALYAQGEDYHFWLKGDLQKVCQLLSEKFPSESFAAFADSAPILERDYAQKAGLGWVGKNSCLINQQTGSLHFLGEIFTTLEVSPNSSYAADRCGTCTRCIDICPTNALIEPRVLDANKCISYLTIEAPGVPTKELRNSMGDWFFGCDLCQTVCPWNQRIWKEQLEVSTQRELQKKSPTDTSTNADVKNSRQPLIEEIASLLNSSNRQLEKRFRGSALLRARPKGLKRNALIVIANQKLHELEDHVKALTQDPYLGELAQWTIEQLHSDASSQDLPANV